MITNQKHLFLRLISLIILLLFTSNIIGQNFISDIKKNGNSESELMIKMTPPNGRPLDIEIKKNTPIKSGTILEIPSKYVVYITSVNGNIGEITGPNTVEFTSSETGEEYRVIKGSGTSNVFIRVLKKLTGGVLASGPTGEIHARSRLTEFLLSIDGDNAEFELIKGKIDINRRQKFNLKDDNVIDSVKSRGLIARETTKLNLKKSKFNFVSGASEDKSLVTDNEIKKFFKKQQRKQIKVLVKSGSVSKSAYRNLNNGNLVEKGITQFEEAIEKGEISTDLIIQSSLMLSDVYFRKGDLKKSAAWLDNGLHFSKYFYEKNRDVYEHYSKISKDKTAKAFGNDFVVANEYYAWAFALKLRLNGCLENSSENPSKYRRNAIQLKREISNY